VATTTQLLLSPQTIVTPTRGFAIAGYAFALDAVQGDAFVNGLVFAKPVTVTIGYEDHALSGPDEALLRLATWDGSAWADAATTCNPVSPYVRNPILNTVSVAICHLSDYALEGRGRVYLPLLHR
jgi:hypothetical protein